NALSIEVATLFKELNWKTGFDIQQQAAKVAEATAQNQSSTFQDVLHQRRTELPYICGYLLQHARQNGLNAPLTESLYQSISALEAAW
ncbi:MAG: ketopantoate reductase C-terminal domain-containing protein, partial [Pseudomonadota bacterium]|nr:ketopantoate reductase C-terminal domain-containing protein [Pseudomonadota bacterium]